MIESVTKNDSMGFRWGQFGQVFQGQDAYARAEAVGRALSARPEDSEWSQAEIEQFVAKAGPERLLEILQLAVHKDKDKKPKNLEMSDVEERDSDGQPLYPMVQKVACDIKKFEQSGELQLVWAEVYVPYVPDAHGNMMTPEEIRKMAHKFLAMQRTQSVDVQHDQDETRALEIVESFIVSEGGHPDGFLPGSWVVCCHVADPHIWADVKSGKLNGFSMEARVFMQQRTIEFEIPDEGISGLTESTEDHHHTYTVQMSSAGVLLGGRTNVVDGHWHPIATGTVTEGEVPSGSDGPPITGSHQHRYSFIDKLFGVPADQLG